MAHNPIGVIGQGEGVIRFFPAISRGSESFDASFAKAEDSPGTLTITDKRVNTSHSHNLQLSITERRLPESNVLLTLRSDVFGDDPISFEPDCNGLLLFDLESPSMMSVSLLNRRFISYM